MIIHVLHWKNKTTYSNGPETLTQVNFSIWKTLQSIVRQQGGGRFISLLGLCTCECLFFFSVGGFFSAFVLFSIGGCASPANAAATFWEKGESTSLLLSHAINGRCPVTNTWIKTYLEVCHAGKNGQSLVPIADVSGSKSKSEVDVLHGIWWLTWIYKYRYVDWSVT